jgi:hypothetical protein
MQHLLIPSIAHAVALQSDGDPSKVPSPPDSPEPDKGTLLTGEPETSQGDSVLAPPQYFIDDGGVRLVGDEGQDVCRESENTLRILQSLSKSPLGKSNHHANTGDVRRAQQEGIPGTTTTDGDRVSLSRADWHLAEDCLAIVHYMNDFSTLDTSMYAEARIAWIRQFGWAPSLQKMQDAKIRALEFRQESGRHINSVMTNQWLRARRTAYDDRGEGTVWQEPMVETSEKALPFTGGALFSKEKLQLTKILSSAELPLPTDAVYTSSKRAASPTPLPTQIKAKKHTGERLE